MIGELLVVAVVVLTSVACGSPEASAPASATGITSEEAARVAPLPPVSLRVVASAGRVLLSWPATGEDVARYRCLRRPALTGGWVPVSAVTGAEHSCRDDHPSAGRSVYGVQAVTGYGVASTITESLPITVR
ncbi:MAG: fibronectin type III domain-containing protein [Actinobacteria bacterium]|nr:fibronectin type III domain-containing protein [Actinomycetota bacterium]MBI3687943.1 fibronectin type III domain-containing protein [Actinomycetota bacterium]